MRHITKKITSTFTSLFGLLGCAMCFSTAHAADQVLIMTISDYPNAPLLGVKHDAGNATQLAQKLGYDTTRAVILKDRQLTAQGIRQALSDFSAKVQTNDRVFFYYSGHGASYLNQGQCAAALVGQDEKLVNTQEIKKHLDQIKNRVQDAFVIFDACHSGGHQDLALLTAGGGARGSKSAMGSTGLTGKTWTPKEGERCDQPVNFTKSWQSSRTVGARSIANPEDNFTFIAASSEQQVALDDKDRGGLATTSLLQCAADGIATNGLATPTTLAMCAQKNINTSVPGLNAKYGSKWTAHDIQVNGNENRLLVNLKVTEPAATIQVQNTVSSNGTLQNSNQVVKSFEQILANANGNWSFSVQPSAQTVSLNQPDAKRGVYFPYRSSQPGYGYVLLVGTDGKQMTQIYPGENENNLMPVQGSFPALRIDGPPGKNIFLFVLSQVPRDFSYIFKGNETETSVSNMTNVQCELGLRNVARINEASPCAANEKRRNVARLDKGGLSASTGLGLEGYAAHMFMVSGK